jgi:hypothetical protein
MPGACAPSTSVSTPRAFSAATIRASGSTSPVGLVTWSTSARRVRGVTPASTTSTTASGSATGNGTVATTTRAPVRSAT